jgi:antitoxin YefM
MLNTNITTFRKDIYNIISATIKYNEPVNVTTKDGNVIVLSEADYNGLIETLYLSSVPGMKDKLIDGMNTSIEDCVDESEVQW